MITIRLNEEKAQKGRKRERKPLGEPEASGKERQKELPSSPGGQQPRLPGRALAQPQGMPPITGLSGKLGNRLRSWSSLLRFAHGTPSASNPHPPTLRQLSLPPSTATFKVTSPGHLLSPQAWPASLISISTLLSLFLHSHPSPC